MPQPAVCCRQIADNLVQMIHARHHMGLCIRVSLSACQWQARSGSCQCGLTSIATSFSHDTFPYSCFKVARIRQRSSISPSEDMSSVNSCLCLFAYGLVHTYILCLRSYLLLQSCLLKVPRAYERPSNTIIYWVSQDTKS